MKRFMGAVGTAALLAGATVGLAGPAGARPIPTGTHAFSFADVAAPSKVASKAFPTSTEADELAKSVLTLGAHSTLLAGHYLISQGDTYALYLSPEGPLSLFAAYDEAPLWTVNVKAANPSLSLQVDGNIVLRDGAGKALWATGTRGVNAAIAFGLVFDNGELSAVGESGKVVWSTKTALVSRRDLIVSDVESPSLEYSVTMQLDGNLVIRHADGKTSKAIWSTGSNRPAVTTKPVVLVLQDDGNLVAYAGKRVLWSSGTAEKTFVLTELYMQNDGNLVLRKVAANGTRSVLWSSGTAGKV